MEETTIKISGMHCNSCARIIEDKLSKLDGVESAKVSYQSESATIAYDSEKVGKAQFEKEITALGYGAGSKPKSKGKLPLKEALIYGIVPHIGCIGFLAASIFGVTVAVEFFKPLLLNPWFFYILIAISLGFATLSSFLYLKKQGLLSMGGIARKRNYLTSMYGITIAVNLLMFFVIFPMAANISLAPNANAAIQGANPTGAVVLPGARTAKLSEINLQVEIPCSGHASLISGELKKINGVTDVVFSSPNQFKVNYDPAKTSKQEILALEVFKTYKATVLSESNEPIPAAGLQAQGAAAPTAPVPSGGLTGAPSGGCGCGSCGSSASTDATSAHTCSLNQ